MLLKPDFIGQKPIKLAKKGCLWSKRPSTTYYYSNLSTIIAYKIGYQ